MNAPSVNRKHGGDGGMQVEKRRGGVQFALLCETNERTVFKMSRLKKEAATASAAPPVAFMSAKNSAPHVLFAA